MFFHIAGHSVRVAVLAYKISRKAGRSKKQSCETLYAALLHDIGKFYVKKSIITAPRSLTSAEYEAVKKHTENGYLKLSKFKGRLNQIAAEVALNHHERIDGSGYRGLLGKDISESAKITALADVYDALTNNRPYKRKTPYQKALIYMSMCRGVYEPVYLEALCKIKLKNTPEIEPLFIQNKQEDYL